MSRFWNFSDISIGDRDTPHFVLQLDLVSRKQVTWVDWSAVIGRTCPSLRAQFLTDRHQFLHDASVQEL